MQIHGNKLLGFSLGAADGEIGKVTDIYFDDSAWLVRYLVIETGNWLFKRKVLISPYVVTDINNINTDVLQVKLNKEQIKNSPNIDTDMPISSQQESSLTNHYSLFGGAGMGWPTTAMVKGTSDIVNKVDSQQGFDPHLRSFRHVAQYEVHNQNGRYGLVKDVVVDLSNWSVPYLLLDDAFTSKHESVVVSTSSILSIDWDTFRINVSLSNKDMQKTLRIDPEGFFSNSSDRVPPLT